MCPLSTQTQIVFWIAILTSYNPSSSTETVSWTFAGGVCHQQDWSRWRQIQCFVLPTESCYLLSLSIFFFLSLMCSATHSTLPPCMYSFRLFSHYALSRSSFFGYLGSQAQNQKGCMLLEDLVDDQLCSSARQFGFVLFYPSKTNSLFCCLRIRLSDLWFDCSHQGNGSCRRVP